MRLGDLVLACLDVHRPSQRLCQRFCHSSVALTRALWLCRLLQPDSNHDLPINAAVAKLQDKFLHGRRLAHLAAARAIILEPTFDAVQIDGSFEVSLLCPALSPVICCHVNSGNSGSFGEAVCVGACTDVHYCSLPFQIHSAHQFERISPARPWIMTSRMPIALPV